jgi:hypothetical protein
MSTSARTVASGGVSMSKDVLGDGYNKVANSMADHGASGGYFKDKIAGKKDV